MSAVAELVVAEDDPDDLFLILHALRRVRPGLVAASVRDGIELIAHLRSRGAADLPRLILMDLNMPRMDGREALAQLRADPVLCAVPVVVLTTSVEHEDRERVAKLDVAGWISKPDEFGPMVHLLHQLLARHLGPAIVGAA